MAKRLTRARQKIAAGAHPVPRARRPRAARPAARRARHRLPGVQRGLRRRPAATACRADARRRGGAAGPAAARADARRAVGARACSRWCCCRTPAAPPGSTPTAPRCCWPTRTARRGTAPRSRRACVLVGEGAAPHARRGPTRTSCRPRSPPATRSRPTYADTDWDGDHLLVRRAAHRARHPGRAAQPRRRGRRARRRRRRGWRRVDAVDGWTATRSGTPPAPSCWPGSIASTTPTRPTPPRWRSPGRRSAHAPAAAARAARGPNPNRMTAVARAVAQMRPGGTRTVGAASALPPRPTHSRANGGSEEEQPHEERDDDGGEHEPDELACQLPVRERDVFRRHGEWSDRGHVRLSLFVPPGLQRFGRFTRACHTGFVRSGRARRPDRHPPAQPAATPHRRRAPRRAHPDARRRRAAGRAPRARHRPPARHGARPHALRAPIGARCPRVARASPSAATTFWCRACGARSGRAACSTRWSTRSATATTPWCGCANSRGSTAGSPPTAPPTSAGRSGR